MVLRLYKQKSLCMEKQVKYYKKEHGFLYLIKHLVNLGYKVEALPIANNKEIISFNSINDLK